MTINSGRVLSECLSLFLRSGLAVNLDRSMTSLRYPQHDLGLTDAS